MLQMYSITLNIHAKNNHRLYFLIEDIQAIRKVNICIC